MPTVSIITATKERPADLKRALRSSLAQEFTDFEHLVADDGSSDNSAARVIQELGDPRVRLVRLDNSQGPAGARNAAVKQARGEFIAILDDDDLMLPGRLATSVAFLREHADCALVAGAYQVIDEDGAMLAVVRPPTDPKCVAQLLPTSNPVCHSTVTLRGDVMRDLQGYREAFRYSHDYDMVLRAARRGRVAILPDVLGAYRFHAKNISAGKCQLQGAYAAAVQAANVAGDDAFDIRLPAIELSTETTDEKKVVGRVHYQLGEWMFRDGRARAARHHLLHAAKSEPMRPLTWALLVASFLPQPVRSLFAPVFQPMMARRYPRWTR
jgi:glycosyltransferase involved in cell wall biosynthesis